MKKFFSFLLALGLIVLPIVRAADPDPTATINVHVQTSVGDKVEGIEITLAGPNSYEQTDSTDSSGVAQFIDLEIGEYTAKIKLLAGGNYELVAGEVASKTRTVAADEIEEIYFGVKIKEGDEVNGEEEEEEEEEANAKIPSAFYKSGSTSTDLSNYSTDQLKAVNNFTLHQPDFSKIVYTQAVDLSSTTAQSRLANLDQYVFLDQLGEVAIASDLMPELDKSATVTLYGLSFVTLGTDYKPTIMKDDVDPEADEVSNITLSGSDTISFDVSGFSAYAVRPTLLFEETEISTETETYTLSGKVDDLDSEITVFMNDSRVNKAITVEDDGTFVVELELEEGENVVQITATGASEQSHAQALTITYTPAAGTSKGTDWTLYAGIALLVVGIGSGGYYYYKTKYLPRKQAQGDPLAPSPLDKKTEKGFDSRLLTPEERIVFNNEENGKNAKK